ncbi:MAG: hypothetical protein OQK72_00750 [Gammaproteobacteria bacterium]|nr:hypothetical protein [Gammaproteobacteria bacterium]MCW9055289.1 hypothetical protein [Gammaproteobacteria bacterium]
MHNIHKHSWHYFTNALLLGTGFILSPLSWWNDAVINLPLAYLFSLPFSMINEQWFLISFVLGYWLTNLLGFLMLHWGGTGIINKQHMTFSIRQSFLISALYSVIVIIMVLVDWIPPPTELLNRF